MFFLPCRCSGGVQEAPRRALPKSGMALPDPEKTGWQRCNRCPYRQQPAPAWEGLGKLGRHRVSGREWKSAMKEGLALWESLAAAFLCGGSYSKGRPLLFYMKHVLPLKKPHVTGLFAPRRCARQILFCAPASKSPLFCAAQPSKTTTGRFRRWNPFCPYCLPCCSMPCFALSLPFFECSVQSPVRERAPLEKRFGPFSPRHSTPFTGFGEPCSRNAAKSHLLRRMPF